MRLKFLACAIFAVVFVSGPWTVYAGELPDTPENRLAAAKRYLQTSPMEDLWQDMVSKFADTLPVEMRSEYMDFMTKHVRIEALEKAAQDAITKHFSVDELNALADFYGSKEGKSIVKKFGDYMADVMPAIQEEIVRAQMEFQSRQ